MRTIIIEIYKDMAQWKMNAFYKGESMGHRQYSVRKVSEDTAWELSSDIFNILSRTDIRGKVTANSLEELRKSAQLLYDQIFSSPIKDEIQKTDATHLIFYIDEQLIHIPWELLHDGTNYLCLRFAIGRVVLTARRIHSEASRDIQLKLKMLALCDPTGDLKKAYEEGLVVRNELDRAKDRIHLDLRTTDVDLKYTMKNLREYDVLHFAGHAKYDQQDPSKSGLILKDGTLTAEKITTLSGASMPTLVFANACSSGETEPWRIEPMQENRIYGLANTFLLAGVKHYIGTFWKVQDRLCMDFAKAFYRNIRKNKSIGEALQLARLQSIEKYGQTALIWASYMLYGDPGDELIPVDEKQAARKLIRLKIFIAIGLAILISGLILGYNLLKQEKPLEELNFNSFKNVFYVRQDATIEKHDRLNVFGGNIAFGKDMYASTVEDDNCPASYASDNDLSTRWSSEFSDPQWIYVDLAEITLIGQLRFIWERAFGRSYDIQVSNNAKRWKTVWRTSSSGGKSDVIDLRGKNVYARYVQMYGKKRETDWGYSLWEFEVYSNLLPNIALGKTVFASSGREKYGAGQAVDGDMGTRWGSDYFDPQWIYVDLEREHRINMVTLHWEPAYGSLYKIQRSDDGKNWIDVCEIQNDKGKMNNIYFESPFFARYVRLYGLERGTEYGYSLWEFEVRGMKERKPR